MAFDWHAAMQETQAIRDDIHRAQRFYKVLSEIDATLLDKAQALAETLGGQEQVVAALRQEEATLKTAVAALETKHRAAKAKVEKDLPGWEAELTEKYAAHVAALDRMKAAYTAAEDERRRASEDAKATLAAEYAQYEATNAKRRALVRGQTEEAEQKLAAVRKAMADLATSAAGV